MRKNVCLLLCLLASVPGSAVAHDCKSGNLNQAELNACAGEAFKAADATLNARFKKITACLKDEAKSLLEAQRNWLKFRDAECKFQGSATEGGSIQPMVVLDCMRGVTEDRNKELNYYLTCEEGDMSCPTVTCGFKDVAPR